MNPFCEPYAFDKLAINGVEVGRLGTFRTESAPEPASRRPLGRVSGSVEWRATPAEADALWALAARFDAKVTGPRSFDMVVEPHRGGPRLLRAIVLDLHGTVTAPSQVTVAELGFALLHGPRMADERWSPSEVR